MSAEVLLATMTAVSMLIAGLIACVGGYRLLSDVVDDARFESVQWWESTGRGVARASGVLLALGVALVSLSSWWLLDLFVLG